jgi:RNA polymerase sigma-54 factor
MATDSGETMSGEAIREVLRELVEQEDKTQPMSDELLASALAKRGIQIARRTVLKYRQALGIPPRRLRRTY